jgi:prepilin-type N-terminal cleavage/methylation domain-containing protein
MKKQTGFTLVEVLVVVSILGLLSSVLMVALQNARMRARDSKRIADLSQISKGLELYYSKHDSYPTLTVPLSECDYVEYPCNAEVDANWQGLISLLRKEGILAEQDWAPETKKQTLPLSKRFENFDRNYNRRHLKNP